MDAFQLKGLSGIISVGILGNLVSIGIFMKKKFSKTNAKNMLAISLLTDSIALLLAIPLINPDWVTPSTVFCKIYQSLTMMIPAYASWILVYISIERYISIVHSTKKIAEIFGNKWFQLICLLGTFMVTFFYYHAQWLYFRVIYAAFLNSTVVYYDSMTSETQPYCFINDEIFQTQSLMDAIYTCVTPFIALISCSFLIIYTLKQARLRLRSSQNEASAQRREQRDFEFAKTILSLDILFLLFHFPFPIFTIIQTYVTFSDRVLGMKIQHSFIYLFYIGYANNIFIYFAFNNDFRAEFLNLFKYTSQHSTTQGRRS
jgi:hypothetical protein